MKEFATADHLFVDALCNCMGKTDDTVFGYVARLERIGRHFTWNKYLNMNPVVAYGDLLFLLSFTADADQATAFNSNVATDGDAVPNAIGCDLRDQMTSILCQLEANFADMNMILSVWRGIEDQHHAFMTPEDECVQPNDLLSLQFYWCGSKLNAIATFKTLSVFDLPKEVFRCASLLSIVSGFRGLPSGSVQIQSTEVHMRDCTLDPDELDEMSRCGTDDQKLPLRINDEQLHRSPESAMMMLDDAMISDDLMRHEFHFVNHFNDIDRFSKFSTIATCLSIAYLREATRTLKNHVSPHSHLHSVRTQKMLATSIDALCDRRLAERARTCLWQRSVCD